MIVSKLIGGALRKLGALSSGASIEASEGVEALEVVQNMYLGFVGEGLFGRQCDIAVPVGSADFTVYPGSRLVTEDKSTVQITLPEFVRDTWWRYDYGHRWTPPAVTLPGQDITTPQDGSLVTLADLSSSAVRTFVYDASLARWTDLNALTMTDEAPLSSRYAEGLMCELAIRLAPEYGSDVPASVALGAARGRSAMASRWDGPSRPIVGVYF